MFPRRSPPMDTSWDWSFSRITPTLEKASISAIQVRPSYLPFPLRICIYHHIAHSFCSAALHLFIQVALLERSWIHLRMLNHKQQKSNRECVLNDLKTAFLVVTLIGASVFCEVLVSFPYFCSYPVRCQHGIGFEIFPEQPQWSFDSRKLFSNLKMTGVNMSSRFYFF